MYHSLNLSFSFGCDSVSNLHIKKTYFYKKQYRVTAHDISREENKKQKHMYQEGWDPRSRRTL